MMTEINQSKTTSILRSTLLGMFSFFISGVLACIVIRQFDNYILATIVAGGIGGLLLALFLSMRKKISRLATGGIVGMTTGMLISFFLVESVGSLIPSIGTNFENTAIPDISAIILMGIIFGLVVGSMVYGRKSIGVFSIVGGTASIPFGFLVASLNSGSAIRVWLDNLLEVFGKIDLNFLAVTISLGVGVGLSIGLYSKKMSDLKQ